MLGSAEPGFPFPWVPGLEVRASVLAVFSGESLLDSKVLLIKRSEEVATHKGQVAFPGGGVELRDSGNLIETALREAEEEVGLSRDRIKPIGFLPSIPTVTGGFQVAPLLAAAPSGVDQALLRIDPREVAFAGWAKVSDLIGTRKEAVHRARGAEVLLPEYDWKGERMWGMTALIFDLVLRRYARIKP